jgi:hypothetical protein
MPGAQFLLSQHADEHSPDREGVEAGSELALDGSMSVRIGR